MINSELLMKKIEEKGYTKEEIAEKINLDMHVFLKKMLGGSVTFTVKEAGIIVATLNLGGNEATEIFFPQLSHKMRQ